MVNAKLTQGSSLSELETKFVEALEKSRNSNWDLGNLLIQAIGLMGQKVAVPHFASLAACSKERIKQLARVAVAFPEEHHNPEQDWSWHLRCYQKAKALGMNPLEIQSKAIEEGWSKKDIALYGIEKPAIVQLDKECPHDRVRVAVSGPSDYQGRTIHCPICSQVLGILE